MNKWFAIAVCVFVAGMLGLAFYLNVLPPPSDLNITPERLAKMVPVIESKKVKADLADQKKAAAEAERRRREAREAAEARRMR